MLADRIIAALRRSDLSAPQLAARLGQVASVRSAMNDLEAQGVIRCVRGSGTVGDPRVFAVVKDPAT